MASEISFAKAFLSALDSRPIKLRADYVHDDPNARIPHLLPRLQPPRPTMPKKTPNAAAAAPGSSKSITVVLKSARNPALELTLPNLPLSTTTVTDLKDAVRARVVDATDAKPALEKIKILHRKKPVTGNRTLAEMLSEEPVLLAGGKEVEVAVMVLGGGRVVPAEGEGEAEGEGSGVGVKEEETPAEPVVKPAVGPSGEEVVKTEAFWEDLQGFLEQRVKDAEEARRLRGLFREAWEGGRK
ncbi:hypothetical protein BO86DRAFT_386398 [Aspergillus japonicus CBS 114.51]|uniref:Cell-cycle control medial ring component n=2 Tax=Aspergillus TaxID=5052 RepID=A0A2V5ICV0_ASPV1|nr:hypothetical protein BO86DRAFT_386398 [Aspergillus japonicus CBS 114.51]PYI17466.1 hypothetical protein BO99DRAFT_483231 [Aspergillus violaceofuscus CBS 115571]RAH85458.1 hypothetical protein BO86DRAFT_386398 [Aspergillus japonicus CBS 114.51]